MKGSCLCGSVRWNVSGDLTPLANCHCSICRKVHGSAFATYLASELDSLSFESGENVIQRYESSAGFFRAFCSQCGSVVPGTTGDHAFIPAGNFDGDPGVRPKIHIFVESKAPWYPITDELRQFEGFPNRDTPKIDRPQHAEASEVSDSDDTLRGSCACNRVAYEVTTPISASYNCHCSRCQKARSAAHATNGFTEPGGVRFVRGEDNLTTYKLPDAQFFTQVFCKTCGSPMPRIDAARDVAVIPYGALDTVPDRYGDAHIYVGSKASWHTISDDIVQLEER